MYILGRQTINNIVMAVAAKGYVKNKRTESTKERRVMEMGATSDRTIREGLTGIVIFE